MLDWLAYSSSRKVLMVLSFMFSGITLLFALFFLFMSITDNWLLFIGEDVFTLFGDFLEIILYAFFWLMGFLHLFISFLFAFIGITFLNLEPIQTNPHKKYILPPDEDLVVNLLRKNSNGLTQKQITLESGLSKVKIHRIIKRLQQKGLIEIYKYGMTNKIILK